MADEGRFSEVEHLLEKLKYGEIIQFVKEEGIEAKGNKEKLVAVILKKVPEEKIRAFFKQARGIKVDISEHRLVPQHEVIGEKELAALVAKHHCKIADLPRTFDTDPMCLKVGARSGDVIKITRKSPTAGQAYYYRLVVKSI
ncbi:MAG: DNA-directed RNA polymerase subunit H [archaeon]